MQVVEKAGVKRSTDHHQRVHRCVHMCRGGAHPLGRPFCLWEQRSAAGSRGRTCICR